MRHLFLTASRASAHKTEPAKARQGETQQALFHNILCVSAPQLYSEIFVQTTIPAASSPAWHRLLQDPRSGPGDARPGDTAPPPRVPAHNTAHQPQLARHAARSLLWEKWITSVFPREQRPASLPAREDSNQLIEAATTTVMALHERHLQVLFLCTSSCRSSSFSHQRRSNLTCLCESSPYSISAIWLIRNFL